MKVITIGSSLQCDVILNTDGIEPVHCQIIQDDDGNYRLAAFGNGICISGKEVKGEILLDLGENNLSIDNSGYYFWQKLFFPVCQKTGYCNYYPESLAYPYDQYCNNCIKHDYSNFSLRPNISQPPIDGKPENGNLLVSIVNKTIIGITEWASEELQYQKNYPQEIENALLSMKEHQQSNEEFCENTAMQTFIVPSYFNLLQRQAVKEAKEKAGFKCRRILSAPSAVALGHYFDKKVGLCRAAILILENGSMDIAIFEIDDGVFEAKSTNGDANIGNNIGCITKLCKKALNDAGYVDIDELILIGNSAYNPFIKQNIEKFFGKTALNITNPDKLQTKGAAVYDSVRAGKTKDILLLDVVPLSVGIEITSDVTSLMIAANAKSGTMCKLIEANTIIPCKKAEIFTTYEDNQCSVEIHVLQGNLEKAADNVTIGRFLLGGISPAPRGVPQIEVTFDIDANEILTVSAKDKKTNNEVTVIMNR
jgi:molecular chaperone DnaK (HSP70)